MRNFDLVAEPYSELTAAAPAFARDFWVGLLLLKRLAMETLDFSTTGSLSSFSNPKKFLLFYSCLEGLPENILLKTFDPFSMKDGSSFPSTSR